MSLKEYYPLDLRTVFASKNATIAEKIPKWLINFLSKVIHIDDLNYLLNRYQNETPLEFAEKSIKYTGAEYRIIGVENIPDERCVFASNHPLGGLDGLILIHSLSNHCKNGVKLIVNDLLMNLTPLRPLFIPVNKHGRQSSESSHVMENAYRSDSQIVTFPAGLCSRLINWKIQDIEWKKNFITKAIETDRVIVPVYFDGRNSLKFYLIARLRKALHIRFNIEMLLLPHEMFYPTTKQITIYIGKAITPDKGKKVSETVKMVRNEVYRLKEKR